MRATKWIVAALLPTMGIAMASPAAAQSASAPSDAKQATASRVVDQMGIDVTVDNLMKNLQPLFAENVVASFERSDPSNTPFGEVLSHGTAGRQQLVAMLGDNFRKSFMSHMPEMKKEVATQYARIFTLEELQQINQFLSSGPGQKWVKSQETLQKELESVGQKIGMTAGMETMQVTVAQLEEGKATPDQSAASDDAK